MSHRSVALLLGALAGCAPEASPPPRLLLADLLSEDDSSGPADMRLYFTAPGLEPGDEEDPELDDALIALLDGATSTVELCLYDFDHEGIIDAALRAWDRGVDLRMVGDADEADDEGYLALADAGVPMTLRGAGDRIMHNKFAVIDEQVVWTGSTNATETGVFMNNNHALVVDSSALAAEYLREFDQMHTDGLFGRKKDDRTVARVVSLDTQELVLHFSPTHDPIHDVVDLVNAAQHSIHFMVFSFTHPDLLAALAAAHDRGVEVVGVFDTSQANTPYSVDEDIALEGVPVYLDGNENSSGWAGGKLHHKVLIVDAGVDGADSVALSGSFNWSKSATDYNDENLLEVRDPDLIGQFREEFCRVWSTATLHPDAVPVAADPCPTRPAVIINELMPDPLGPDRGQEYVELVNVGSVDVDLDGWSLHDRRRRRHRFGPLVLGPGEGVVVFDHGDHSAVPHAVVSSTGLLSLNRLNERVALFDAEDVEVDAVTLGFARPGVSLNRSPDLTRGAPLVPHGSVENAAGSSSPGLRADGRPLGPLPPPDFQIVINEGMPNPAGTDRGQEYVELVNLGPDDAPLVGLELWDASGLRHTFVDGWLAAGAALVLVDLDNPALPGATESTTGSLSLNNTGDTLSLYLADGALHDEVSWSGSREGVAWNRAVDGGEDPELADHDTVAPDGSPASPGLRADGSSW
jgi:phosphatidylserine/phosphatidylglycerophosphate/cardiolipin synthase-like enzyme